MSLDKSALFKQETAKDAQAQLLHLVILHLPAGGLLRVVDSNDTVTFAGQNYAPFPLQYNPPTQAGDGSVSRASLMVANPRRALMPYIEQDPKSLRGCRLEVLTVWSNLLAFTAASNYMHEEFLIDAFTATEQTLNLQLDPVIRVDTPLPRRLFMNDCCGWRWKDTDTCGYVNNCNATIDTGSRALALLTTGGISAVNHASKFALNDVVILEGSANTLETYVVSAPSQDSNTVILNAPWPYSSETVTVAFKLCGKTLKDCQKRLNSKYFGGFPGVPDATRRFYL